jgi:3-dehydroquinate synthetase
MLKDKKRKGRYISFVLLSSIGDSVVEDIEIKEIEKHLYDLC